MPIFPLPTYQALLHAGTRDALGVTLKDNVVVIDEAHNLLDALNDMHSVTLTARHLSEVSAQLAQYAERYNSRFKPANRIAVQQLLNVVRALRRSLSALARGLLSALARRLLSALALGALDASALELRHFLFVRNCLPPRLELLLLLNAILQPARTKAPCRAGDTRVRLLAGIRRRVEGGPPERAVLPGEARGAL